jgi:hypothetical protein
MNCSVVEFATQYNYRRAGILHTLGKWLQVIFFIIKPTRCTNFTNLFCHETLHVSVIYSANHQEFIHLTQEWYVPYRFVGSFRARPGWNCSSIQVLLESCVYSACMIYTIAEFTVNKLLTIYRGTVRNIQFHARIKL